MVLHPLGNGEDGLVPGRLVLVLLAEAPVDSPGQSGGQHRLQVGLGLLPLLEVGQQGGLLGGVAVLVQQAGEQGEQRHHGSESYNLQSRGVTFCDNNINILNTE